MNKTIPINTPDYSSIGQGVLPPQAIRDFKGVNTFDPLSIPENFFTDAVNLVSDDYPAVSTRPGYTVLGSAIGTKVLGLGVWKDTELHAVFNDGTWRKWTGSAWTTLKSGLNTSAMWSFTSFEGGWGGINLVGANGVDGLHRYDGSTLQTFGDAPANINYVTTYQNRIWGAFGMEIRACKLDDGNSWNSFPGTDEDSFGRVIESIRGEEVNMLSGSLSKLTIGMPNSLHELYGGVPSDFKVRMITEQEGTVNNQSSLVQESLLRFMHPTGVFEYFSGGMFPSKEFSEIIRGKTRNITSNAAAGTDNTKLYMYDGTSRTLVYDPRDGVQAWFTWTGFVPTCFIIFRHELYAGDTSGRVLKLGGQNDAGTPISWYAITKPFTNAVIAQRQRWLKMWITAELGTGSSVNVYLSKTIDGDDWQLTQTFNTPGSHRIIIPVSSFVLENTVRLKIEGTGWVRLHEITRQIRQLPLY